jgi:hypothetical protein
MSRSDLAFRWAARMRGVAKATSWLWVKAHVGWTGDLRAGDHWFSTCLSNLLGLRIPIWTRLRSGMEDPRRLERVHR